MNKNRKNVAVIGAGFGGLQVVKKTFQISRCSDNLY